VLVSDVVRKWRVFWSTGRTSMQVDMCSFTRVHGLGGVNSRSSVFESEHSCNT
jgi:hypothetical protein